MLAGTTPPLIAPVAYKDGPGFVASIIMYLDRHCVDWMEFCSTTMLAVQSAQACHHGIFPINHASRPGVAILPAANGFVPAYQTSTIHQESVIPYTVSVINGLVKLIPPWGVEVIYGLVRRKLEKEAVSIDTCLARPILASQQEVIVIVRSRYRVIVPENRSVIGNGEPIHVWSTSEVTIVSVCALSGTGGLIWLIIAELLCVRGRLSRVIALIPPLWIHKQAIPIEGI